MRSARRRRFVKTKNFSFSKKIFKLVFFILALVILSVIVLFVFTNSENWDGKSKLNLVINSENGEIVYASFDPTQKEITAITIPSDLQVNVSRNLGVMKIKNVWELGKNQDLDGKLVSETFTRDLKLINYLWSDGSAKALVGSNALKKLAFVFSYSDTNLSLKDKFKLAIFSIGVNSKNIERIDLSDTGFISKSELIDGSRGYVVSGSLPPRIIATMSDSETLRKNINVLVEDETKSSVINKDLGEIIEVFGGKISLIENLEPKDSDCEISGSDEAVLDKLSKILECKKVKDKEKSGFDIKLVIGENYAKRF